MPKEMGATAKPAASAIEIWPVAKLIPYIRNPRKHSEEVINRMVGSIREFGFKIPVLARSNGAVVDGHLRLKAARRAGIEEVPVILCDEWSDAQVKAFRLMANKSVMWAEWDEELLAVELDALKDESFDLAFTGFDEKEIQEVFERAEEISGDDGELAPAEEEVPEAVQKLLDRAWVLVAQNWQYAGTQQFRWLSPDLTPGVAAWHFIRAKYLGGRYPRKMSLAFCPAQFETPGDHKGSSRDLLRKIARADAAGLKLLPRLRFGLSETPSWQGLTSASLPLAGHKMPLDFPAELAQALINSHCPPGGSVLDPCHGWGGRCVGFLLADTAQRYVGCDPSPEAHAAVQELANTFQAITESEREIVLHQSPFEDVGLHERFDFALTSPPYFDREQYSGADSSFRRYKTFDQWVEGFYKVLIHKVYALLKPNGAFALQVGSQIYPLAETGKRIARAAGFRFESVQTQILNTNFTQTEAETSESVLLFKK